MDITAELSTSVNNGVEIPTEKVVISTLDHRNIEKNTEELNLSVTKEIQEETIDIEALSTVFTGNVQFSAKAVLKSSVHSKIKLNGKLETIQLKLEEATKKDCAFQNKIAEVRQDVNEMKTQADIHIIDIKMLIDDLNSVPIITKELEVKYQNVLKSLNDAVQYKEDLDKKLQRIINEDKIFKENHVEKVEKLKKEIEEFQKNMENSKKIREKELEDERKLLEEKKNKFEGLQNKKNNLKNDFENKNKKLEEIKSKKTFSENEKDQLFNRKENLNSEIKDLTFIFDSLQNEIQTQKNSLKQSKDTYDITEKNYNEVKHQLEEVKNKNISLSNDVIKNTEKLENLKLENNKKLNDYNQELEKLNKDNEEKINLLTIIRNNNKELHEKIDNSNKILFELRDNITLKNTIFNEVKTQNLIKSEQLNSSEKDFEMHKEKLTEFTLLKESLQKKFEDLSKIFEMKKGKLDIMNNIKEDLQKTKDITANEILEKEKFYNVLKENIEKEFEILKSNQNLIIKNEEEIVAKTKEQLETLQAEVESINAKANVLKTSANHNYQKHLEIEKENNELNITLMKLKGESSQAEITGRKQTRQIGSSMSNINPATTAKKSTFDSSSRSKSFARKQSKQKGILKPNEAGAGVSAKTVSFDPKLGAVSGSSEDSIDKIFKGFLGNSKVEEKKPTPEELFDSMIRNSPPEKDY